MKLRGTVPVMLVAVLAAGGCVTRETVKGVYGDKPAGSPDAAWTLVLDRSGRFLMSHRAGPPPAIVERYEGRWTLKPHELVLTRTDGGIETFQMTNVGLDSLPHLLPRRPDQPPLVWQSSGFEID
jgi:hypothetical protein